MIAKILLGLTAAIALSVTAFAGKAGDNVLNVYNWADYIGEDTIAEFEAETGIKVRYDFFDSIETLETKMLTGGAGYDVIFPPASMGERLIVTDTLQKIDKSKLSNYGNLDTSILESVTAHDKGNAYLIPYTWGTIGVSYNAGRVNERMANAPVNSLDMFFKPEIISKFANCGIAMIDSPQEVMGITLNYLELDPYTNKKKDIEAAQQLISSIRPHIQYFGGVKIIDDMATGEICLALMYSGDSSMANYTASEANNGVEVLYAIPEQGTSIWFDSMAIPTDAPNVDNAHVFLNYMLRGEVMADTSNYIFYANGNAASLEFVIDDVKNDPNIYPSDEVRKRLYPDLSLPQKSVRLRTRAWTRIKTGN